MLAVNGNRWNILINFKWKQNWMDDLVGKSQKYWEKEKIKISCLSWVGTSAWESEPVLVAPLSYWPAPAVVNPFALRRWAVLVCKAGGVLYRRSGNASSSIRKESFKLENLFPFMNSPYVTKGRTRSIKSCSAVRCSCLRCLSCPKQSSHPWESFKLENLFPFMNSPYDTSGCSSF